jgi:hypothetical protein
MWWITSGSGKDPKTTRADGFQYMPVPRQIWRKNQVRKAELFTELNFKENSSSARSKVGMIPGGTRIAAV